MFHSINDAIIANCSLNSQGQACILFSDPAYVRAEKIILDLEDSSIHAVLHESLHLIGRIDDSLRDVFKRQSEINLSAPHYFSGMVKLKSPLVISG
ncbi:MAG: hypothetical protein WBK77_01855 [Alphaproteobacteria bacterium]